MTAPSDDFISRASLAGRLDVAESTIDELVRRGTIPKPLKLSPGCVRWDWLEVRAALASLKETENNSPRDPYLAGASNVAKLPERRGAASTRRS